MAAVESITYDHAYLKIANGSFARVTEMLEGILDAQARGAEFKQRLDGRGRKPLIIDNDYCAKIVNNAMASGQSIQSSAHMVNVVREGRGEQPVSWSALHRFVSNSDIIQTHRRQTKKVGKMTRTLFGPGLEQPNFFKYCIIAAGQRGGARYCWSRFSRIGCNVLARHRLVGRKAKKNIAASLISWITWFLNRKRCIWAQICSTSSIYTMTA